MEHVHADTVRTLRLYYDHGYSVSDLVGWSGLGRVCVSRIVHRRTHRRVTDRPFTTDTILPPLRPIEEVTF